MPRARRAAIAAMDRRRHTPEHHDATAQRHVPVLTEAVVTALRAQAPAGGMRRLFDGTLGLGGHARVLLNAFPRARVTACDRDPTQVRAAVAGCAELMAAIEAGRLAVHTSCYRLFLEAAAPESLDAVVLDLGLATNQIGAPERGFSYAGPPDAPLDMRFDPTEPVPTASDWLTSSSRDTLVQLLRAYGEEPRASRIATTIVAARRSRPIATVGDLVRLLTAVAGAGGGDAGRGPGAVRRACARTFQALRIAVNHELECLAGAIPAAHRALRPDGMLAILTFHSLEDRLVKWSLHGRAGAEQPYDVRWRPPPWVDPTRIFPSIDECRRNPRATSAILRLACRRAGDSGGGTHVTTGAPLVLAPHRPPGLAFPCPMSSHHLRSSRH